MPQDHSSTPPPTLRFQRLAHHLAELEKGGWDLSHLQVEVDAAHSAQQAGHVDVAQRLAEQVLVRVTEMLKAHGVSLPADEELYSLAVGEIANDEMIVVDDMSSAAHPAVVVALPRTPPSIPNPAPAMKALAGEAAPTEAWPDQSATTPAVPLTPPASAPTLFGTRQVARDGQMPGTASVRIAAQLGPLVERTVSDRVSQVVGALRAEFAARPTPLEGEALAKEIEYHVERIAAERGWCSLSDVQSLLDSQHREGDAPPLAFARLEAAITEFVRQTQSQQERFLSTFAERIAQGTHTFTQRLAGAAVVGSKAGTSEGEAGLDAVAPGMQTAAHAVRAAHSGTTSTFSRQSPSGAQSGGSRSAQGLRRATEQVFPTAESADGGSALDATVASRQDSISTEAIGRLASGARVAVAATGELAPPLAHERHLSGLQPVPEAVFGQAANTRTQPQLPAGSDLSAMLRTLLPELLQEPAVRNRILAIVAVEAFTNPGALGELSGLRSFLRQELRQAVANLPVGQPA